MNPLAFLTDTLTKEGFGVFNIPRLSLVLIFELEPFNKALDFQYDVTVYFLHQNKFK